MLHRLSIKNTHQNPLGSFKDLSVNRDRQREPTMFILCYDNMHNIVEIHFSISIAPVRAGAGR
jgi:hypothetical protein